MRRFPSGRSIVAESLWLFAIVGLVNCSADSPTGLPAQVSHTATLPTSLSVVVPPAVVYEDVAPHKPTDVSASAAPAPTPSPLPPPRKEAVAATPAPAEVPPPSRPAPAPPVPAAAPPVSLPTNTVIRNADLVRLTRDGASESDIVSVLKSNRLDLDTSISALVDLKNAGVSDRIIKAMLESAKAAAPVVLRNADVVRMTRSGQNDAAVIAAIRSSKTEFDVSTSGLVALKREGVSDAVIDAVLAATKKR